MSKLTPCAISSSSRSSCGGSRCAVSTSALISCESSASTHCRRSVSTFDRSCSKSSVQPSRRLSSSWMRTHALSTSTRSICARAITARGPCGAARGVGVCRGFA
eukprot:6480929-Prymnesium_polylepis.1